MSIRKLMVLIGLALALAALIPASALARKEGLEKITKGSTEGVACTTVGAYPNPLPFTLESTGKANGVGRFTVRAWGAGEIDFVADTYEGSGNWTMLTASGDILEGSAKIEVLEGATASPHEDITHNTITGGTGKFAGVTGYSEEHSTVTTVSTEEEILLTGISCSTFVSTFTAHLTY
jgi:hypothetical protein